ncbi:MAG: NADH dehydrogenase FAD-containing subunit [Nitrospinae bacterium]|nr:NADH dehydrogenase FAD-containing subunit [Nitrospinota bacterium]
MTLAIVLTPALAGVAALLINWDKARRKLLVAAAAAHSILVGSMWLEGPSRDQSLYFALDPLGLYFITITSTLFMAASIYGADYLAREDKHRRPDFEDGSLFSNQPEKFFTGFLLLFLSAMSFVAASRHLGMIWIAIECTTLVSAPLIYFHRRLPALEAMWKYLLVCSVGIALALLGVFSMATAAVKAGGPQASLSLAGLASLAGSMDHAWLKMAFIFLFVGFGTKMGLAPFHMWLPDAHGESPSMVSALLSGSLLNCAFLGILRTHQTLLAAGMADFTGPIFISFGLFSMLAAAIFIIRQEDFKKTLAYSSVEHMGILALGVGIGGAGVFGAMLHVAAHSLTKASLFMTAGNILGYFRTKNPDMVKGAIKALPVSGILWVGGFMAITGAPPFPTFISEFTILKAAVDGGYLFTAFGYLFLLAVIFIGMAVAFLPMAYGDPTAPSNFNIRTESSLSYLPPAILLLCGLTLTFYMPQAFIDTLHQTAAMLGGGL